MTAEPPKRRRWFQFRLRTLLIAVLVLSLPLSWLAVKVERARRQYNAVEAFRGLGGTVLYEGRGLFSKKADIPQRGPSWLRNALGPDFFDSVVDVYLTGLPATDVDLEHLKALPHLEVLELGQTRVTPGGLTCLKRLTNLKVLGLTGTQVTDAGMPHLEGLTNLETLLLWETSVTDAGLRHLERLTSLRFLGLGNNSVTDSGLEHLEGLPHLGILYLDNTQVTDAGLEHLKGLTSLKGLYLHHTHVTPEGLKKLQEALPNCDTEY